MELIGAGILYIIGLVIGWLLHDEKEQAKRR